MKYALLYDENKNVKMVELLSCQPSCGGYHEKAYWITFNWITGESNGVDINAEDVFDNLTSAEEATKLLMIKNIIL